LALSEQFISILIPNCLNLDADEGLNLDSADEKMDLMGATVARLARILRALTERLGEKGTADARAGRDYKG
jgi:hypothetical protein